MAVTGGDMVALYGPSGSAKGGGEQAREATVDDLVFGCPHDTG
jgi:hypothetical protein